MATDCLPKMPFDFLQPQMKHQISQVGYGGPIVIRSNPVGALVDFVRGICFPVPMEEDEGGGYVDESGLGLDSPGAGSVLLGPGEGTPFIGGFGSGPPQAGFQGQGGFNFTQPPCGPGFEYSADTQGCVPVGQNQQAPLPCSYEQLETARQRLLDAVANCDHLAIKQVRYQAGVCKAISPSALRAQWNALLGEAINRDNNFRRFCMRQMAMASNQQAMIAQAQTARQSPRVFPRQMPSPLQLTEATPRFATTQQPMAGTFDPSRQTVRSPRRFGGV